MHSLATGSVSTSRCTAGRRIFSGLLLGLLSLPALAGPVSVYQQARLDWTYNDKDGNQKPGAYTETLVNNFGSQEVRPTVQGLGLAEIDFFTDVDNGAKVRTKTDVAFGGTLIDSDDNNLTHLEVSTTQRVIFQDRVSTDDPNGKIFRFATQVTGFLGHTVKHEGFTCNDLYSSSVNIASGIGANFTLESASIDSEPGCGFNLDPVNDAEVLNLQALFIDLLYEGDPLDFEFEVSEQIDLILEGPDLGFWSALLQNDLRNTITTRASVYDITGNLLPDARVQSSLFNLTYEPLALASGPSTVPTPSSLALLALGFAAMWRTKYRLESS